MDGFARLAMALVGAMLGARFFGPVDRVAGAVVGALVALGAAELHSLRSRVRVLESRQMPETSGAVVLVPQTPLGDDAVEAGAVEVGAAQGIELARPEIGRLQQPSSTARPADVSAEIELPLVRWLRQFLLGGNAVVRVGIIILFFGVAFLLRYMAEHARVPIEWRLAGIGTGGVAQSRNSGESFRALTTEYTPLPLTALDCPSTRACIGVGGNTLAQIALTAIKPAAATLSGGAQRSRPRRRD